MMFHQNNFRCERSRSRSKGRGTPLRGDRIITQRITSGQQQKYISKNPGNESPYKALLYKQLSHSQERLMIYSNSEGDIDNSHQDIQFRLQPAKRQFPAKYENQLDAPGVADDYYQFPLDWSKTNVITLISNEQLYSYNYTSGAVNQYRTNQHQVAYDCVRCNKQRNCLLVAGTSKGSVDIFDLESMQLINRFLVSQRERKISCVSVVNETIVASCVNGKIFLLDARKNNIISTLYGHQDQAFGVRLQGDSFSDNSNLLASCGGSGEVLIWDLRMRDQLLHRFKGHTHSVKALDWSPFRSNTLVSGGGDQDKTINVWDAALGTHLTSQKVPGQVTSMIHSDPQLPYQELYTGHGYQDNAIMMWNAKMNYRQEDQVNDHRKRVLALALSPDGTVLCSLGADEIIKFWRISENQKSRTYRMRHNHLFGSMQLR